MSAIVRALGVLSLLLPAAACSTFTWDLDQLRETRPSGGAFETALAKEYLAFSETEKQQFDWLDSAYYARKGRSAAAGRTPLPENPEDWRTPAAAMPALTEGRTRLVTALDNTGRQRLPQVAARAQALFDCWVEQQEENWQVDDIAACRDGFFAQLQQLEAPPPSAQPAPAAAPAPAPAPAAAAQMPEVYLVFFDFDRAQISPVAMRVLDRVLEDFRRGRFTQIVVAGHADKSGPDTYNERLAQRRARAVADYLAQKGVPRNQMTSQSYGEIRPRVPTNDGIREAENRRVEITLGQR